MNLADFKTLLTPTGRGGLTAAVALAPREQDYLAHFQKLSKQYPPALARAALETAILRLEARKKFGDAASKLYFTREALQQATPQTVATHRATRFAPFSTVLDLGCSIAGDTIPLARAAARVIALDRDPLRLAMARANLDALGLSAHFLLADLNHPLPISTRDAPAIFFDPARRANHRRIFSIQDYQPPLATVNQWAAQHPAIGVKISPGVKLDQLVGFDCEIEFVSLRGALKEACLWFGPLKTAGVRATVLPGGHTMTGNGRPGTESQQPISAPQSFLYEPDPAVLRAGLVTTLGKMLGASQLDPTIAYLTGEKLIATPFARAWQIEDWMPFHLKKLRAYLRARNIGKVTVKKRGSAITPEQLIADLKLKRGDDERVLVLTKLRGKPIVIVLRGATV